MTADWVVRAVHRLEAWQNPDGGWGESCRGYDAPERFVPAESTPSQTAWALMGLLAAGRGDSPAVRRGVRHLVETQAPDGAWDEPPFTGTGFPRVFYLKYPMYRKYFPLLALSKWLRA
jgi:squalene-hopene/tetraprenyl-beta-curcumene cyclase